MLFRLQHSARSVLLTLGILLASACSDGDSDSGPGPGPGPSTATLSGQLQGLRTLSPDTTYTILGILRILPGGSLVVPAGTVLESDVGTRGSIVTRRCDGASPSGRLVVQGTAGAPVVFRPAGPTSGRARGQAGGIVLDGCAPVNNPGGSGLLTGIGEMYGGADGDDSSGEIHYLVVEFGGLPTTSNEAAALTMAGVGSGTRIDHVQAHFPAGDGFAWFGGSVNASFLVSSGASDDGFDCDNGWTGALQFGVILQDPDMTNRGVECDNDAAASSNAPLSTPLFWNLTLVGAGIENGGTEPDDGLYFRRGAAGAVLNSVVVNFGNLGTVIDGAESFDLLETEDLFLSSVLFFGNRGLASPLARSSSDAVLQNVNRLMNGQYVDDGLLDALDDANSTFFFADPLLTSMNMDDPLNGSQPNLLPLAGSPLLDPANAERPVGAGIVDDSARYLGAFSSSNWLDDWTTWALD